jgi:hypothetical protein
MVVFFKLAKRGIVSFKGYIIENDFQLAFETNKEQEKLIKNDEESQMKCYPIKTTTKTPYQKIEIEIRKNKQWPPITTPQNDLSIPLNGNLLRIQSTQNRTSNRKQRTISTNSAQSVISFHNENNSKSKIAQRTNSQVDEEYTRV